MADTTCWRGKARANEHGVTWAASRSGDIQIALARSPGGLRADGWDVWALYTGTHDLAPVTRTFTGAGAERAARAYANELWRTR